MQKYLKIDLASILFFLTIAFGWMNIISPGLLFLSAYLFFGVMLLFNEMRYLTVYARYLFYLLVGVSILSLLKMFMDLPASIVTLFYFVIDCSLAHALIRGNVKPLIINALFYMVAVFFFYQMIIGADPDLIFESSRNAVSLYTLFAFMPLIFLYRNNKIFVPVAPAILFWILAIYGVGRSGILSASLTLIAILFSAANFSKSKNYRITRMINFYKILLIILSGVLLFYNIEIADMAVYKFMVSGLEDDVRSIMINSYFQKTNLINFFVGIDLSTIPYVSDMNNNPHNYFLALHSSLGIVGAFMIISVVFYVIREMVNKNFLYAVMIGTYLFRIFTDSGMGMFSFVFVYLVLNGMGSMHELLKKINKAVNPASLSRQKTCWV